LYADFLFDLFTEYDKITNMSNMMGAISRAGIAYPCEALEVDPGF
jgi:hypothetical protein